jgi:hypothetical protein
LDGKSGAWFLLSHPSFHSINNFLGLSDVKVGLLEGTPKATRHFTQFILVQGPFVLEQAKGAKDSL